MVDLGRMSRDERTRTYVARRTAEGKSKKEIIRCLKRTRRERDTDTEELCEERAVRREEAREEELSRGTPLRQRHNRQRIVRPFRLPLPVQFYIVNEPALLGPLQTHWSGCKPSLRANGAPFGVNRGYLNAAHQPAGRSGGQSTVGRPIR